MKTIISQNKLILFLCLAFLSLTLLSCGEKKPERGGHGHGGASATEFAEGKGLLIPEVTAEAIGLKMADVVGGKTPGKLKIVFQIFEVEKNFARLGADLEAPLAEKLSRQSGVELFRENETFRVLLARVEEIKAPFFHAGGPRMVSLFLENHDGSFRVGDFLQTSLDGPIRENPVVPLSAVLHAAAGTFVYVENGERLLRQEVKVGEELGGQIEILDGLYPGDRVAVKPVEWLYLIELRAVKGGGHSH